MLGTLQRMVFGELLRTFALALVGLTGLFLCGGVIQEAAQRGLAPSQVLLVIPLLLPSTLPYTVPATTLFAACVVYGRMAHDNEITALRAAGVRLTTLLVPGLVLGAIASAATFAVSCDVIPRSRTWLAKAILRDADEVIYGMLKRTGCLRHPQLPFAMYVREVRGKRLIDPVFKRRDPKGGYALVAHAKEATLWTDPVKQTVCLFMPRCSVAGSGTVDAAFRDQTFELPMPALALSDTQLRPANLTWSELAAKLAAHGNKVVEIEGEIAEVNRVLAADSGQTEPLKAVRAEWQRQLAGVRREMTWLRAERQLRPALACGSLALVVVAFAVGILMNRADYLGAFVSCFLPVVFAYYPLLLCGNNLARDGKLPPEVAAWAANAVTVAVGIALARPVMRR